MIRSLIHIACVLLLLGGFGSARAQYTVHKIDGHVIHVVVLQPKEYEIRWVKAGNRLLGRETVAAMAIDNHADIAINAGFFEIGNETDGRPSGTLIVDGKVFRFKSKKQACLMQTTGKLSIGSCGRLMTEEGKLMHPHTSAVSGIPQLITDHQINPEIFQKKTSFYTQPHARTAVGIKDSGEVVLVVAENAYAQVFQALIEAQLHQSDAKQPKIPIEPLAVGLTLPELARFMQTLGCASAINLDGGGSSTLWMEGKVVNRTIGDEDEAAGYAVLRPVSDIIAFKKR